jgi:co-chaperonin GroES (HSP10)
VTILKIPRLGEKLDFSPFHDWLLLEPLLDAITEGGVALPEGASADDLIKARVVRKGPGRVTENGTTLPTDFLELGDLVFLPPTDRQLVWKSGGKNYILTRARDLIAGPEKRPAAAQALAA